MDYFPLGCCELWLHEVILDEYAVRGAFIRSLNSAVVWDTLSRPADMAAYLPHLDDRRLFIVYSHADYDHIWGTAGLPYVTAEIIAERSALDRFQDDVPRTLAQKQQLEPHRWQDVILVPPTVTFTGTKTLDLGSTELMLQAVPGHTADSIVAFLPAAGLLLAGDAVEHPVVEITQPERIGSWLAALRQWADEPRLKKVIPAHGLIGGREQLWETIGYLESMAAGLDMYPEGTLSGFYGDVHRQNLTVCGA